MKRRFITERRTAENYVPISIPDGLKDYADDLRFLKDVPLTYLIPNAAELSEESIRFFCLDVNWTDALLDGAFSIGRVCVQNGVSDKAGLRAEGKDRPYRDTPRMKRMHPNHKNALPWSSRAVSPDPCISGFLLRSQLVRRMKGLHLYGYDRQGMPQDGKAGTPLEILRMDTIADDVMLCLFRGKVCEITLEEPRMGLCFGVSSVIQSGGTLTRSLDLRSALEGNAFGKRIGSMCIDEFTDRNGRLHAQKLAQAMGTQLTEAGQLDQDRITPSRFAFEMIAVAHRATFSSLPEEARNG